MNDKTRTVDISIMGRSYKVNCAEEERESLLQAATYLDQKMNEIRSSGRVGQSDRIAVMAALNIAHELLSMKVGAGFDIGDAKRRINSIEAKLDAAIAQQEKLF